MKNLFKKLSIYERTLLGTFLVLTVLLAAVNVYLGRREAVHLKVVKIEGAANG